MIQGYNSFKRTRLTSYGLVVVSGSPICLNRVRRQKGYLNDTIWLSHLSVTDPSDCYDVTQIQLI